MALPATDSFTQAGAGHGALGANWTVITGEGTPQVNQTTDVVEVTSVGSDAGAFWNADTFNTNHYATIKAISAASTTVTFISAAVRVQSGARQYYKGGCFGILGGSVTYQISKRNGATNTVLKSGSTAVSANDLLSIEASGTTLTLKKNGVSVDSTSDLSFSGGAAGFFLFVDSGVPADATLDNWEGGDLAAGGGTTGTPFRFTLMGVQ